MWVLKRRFSLGCSLNATSFENVVRVNEIYYYVRSLGSLQSVTVVGPPAIMFPLPDSKCLAADVGVFVWRLVRQYHVGYRSRNFHTAASHPMGPESYCCASCWSPIPFLRPICATSPMGDALAVATAA